MPRKIPPFASIRAFEALARLGRQSDAARELNITTSAISHQIRALEAYLGAALFQRDAARHVQLTEEGRTVLVGVSRALDGLDEAFSHYTRPNQDQVLSIHMYQSLANLWFIPRLAKLRAALPHFRVRIITEPEEISLSGSDVDLAIVFADTPPQEERCVKLFDELIEPVCAPDYYNAQERPPKTADMRFEPLIHSRHYWEEWSRWFDHAGLAEIEWCPVIETDNRSNALQAASNGVGWAMDRRPFGEELRQNGHLIAPFDLPVHTGNAYYLVTSYRSEGSTNVIHFRNWIVRLCQKEFSE